LNISKRAISLVAIGVVFGAIGVTIGFRSSQASDGNFLLGADTVLPGICQMESLIEQKRLAESRNVFYNAVHINAHALGAMASEEKVASAEAYFRAKGEVERDLSILSPNLGNSVPKFEQQIRKTMKELQVFGDDRRC
jgi:hypothetical protein